MIEILLLLCVVYGVINAFFNGLCFIFLTYFSYEERIALLEMFENNSK